MANAEEASFEELLDKLEGIVGKLEEGDLGLEESLKAYEEGVALVRGAQGRLDAMESRLQQLTEGGQLAPLEDRA
jgi:exodeoxyribonuclease VII small subunit